MSGTPDGDNRTQLRRATTSLERLHAFLIGFAITGAAKAVLEPWLGKCGDTAPSACSSVYLPLTQLLLFFTLLITIIPFYHGANRHLDATHLDSNCTFSRSEFLVDYFLLFLEGAMFAAIGLSIVSIRHFVWTFVALILVDSAWALLTWPLLSRRGLSATHIRRWLILNAAAVGGLIIATRLWHTSVAIDLNWFPYANAAAWWLCCAAVIRTAVDYSLNRHWYFPVHSGLVPSVAAVNPAAGSAPAIAQNSSTSSAPVPS